MPVVKKLIFALPFLAALAYFFYLINSILNPTEILFSLSLQALYQMMLITGILLLSGFFFVLFDTFAQDWRFVVPIIVLASLLPFAFLPPQVSLVVAVGTLITFLFVFIMLNAKLKSYLTFQPVILLTPSMKSISTYMLIFISIASFQFMKTSIQEKGFQIPDPLMQTVYQFTASNANQADLDSPLLSPDACQLLKTNPQLLLKSGVSQDQIDLIDPATCKLSQSKMQERLKDQALAIIKPYTQYLPYLLALTLFLSLTSVAALLGILLPFLVWIMFLILKSVGFTKFTTEMREVKKLVI